MNKARRTFILRTTSVLAVLVVFLAGVNTLLTMGPTSAARPRMVAQTTPALTEKLHDVTLRLAECQDLLMTSVNPSSQRTRALDCIHDNQVLKNLYEHASPSPSPSGSPTPTGTPTVSSSPTPSPTPTVTGSPTPTPTPTVTPTPTPTPTPTVTGPLTNCIDLPSRCGWPDRTNTGVRPGHTLEVVNGTVHVPAGITLHDLEIHGDVVFDGNNAGLLDVRVINDSPFYAIQAAIHGEAISGLNLNYVDVDLNGFLDTKGLAFNGFTVDHSLFHNGADCIHFSENVAIRNTACYLGPEDARNNGWCEGHHVDGFQTDGGNNVVIDHNTVINPCNQTAPIMVDTDLGATRDVHVTNNLLNGGGYEAYCNTRGVPVNPVVELVDNRWARTIWPAGGFNGISVACDTVPTRSGNVWDDNNQPVQLG